MNRTCEPELLDHLPADDSRAMRSRRDLRRVNAWMGNVRFIARALNSFLPIQTEPKILEIGAGDGTLMLKVAKRLRREFTAVLLDRQSLVTPGIRARFRQLGCEIEAITGDVFEYFHSLTSPTCQTCPTPFYHAVTANLFLHHFSDSQLSELFRIAAQVTPLFIAVEPRRSPLALFGGRLLWAIGCNSVTRHDAIVSIRAGFSGRELSSLWPATGGWTCEELPAGFSSHLFIARAVSAP